MSIRFERNSSKADSNLAKHGINFLEALRIFADPNLLLDQDRIVDGERRWQAIGVAESHLVLVVAHTSTEEEPCDVIRIIPARRADRKEKAF